MFKRQLFLLLLLVVVSLLLPQTALAQESTKQQAQVEYLQPVEIELRASPGETVSQSIDVPVKVTRVDGSVYYETSPVTFEITNTRIEPTTQGEIPSSLLLRLPARTTITYLRCSGVLNQSSRAYTSFVDWHYDGSSLWHDANGNLNHSASSPWVTNGTYEYANYPYGPLSSTSTWNTGYFKNSSAGPSTDEASHSVHWVLERNGDCTATGFIDLY